MNRKNPVLRLALLIQQRLGQRPSWQIDRWGAQAEAAVDHARRLEQALALSHKAHDQGLWTLNPTDRAHAAVVDQAMAAAQALVATAAKDPEADARARNNAQSVLESFCQSLGWRIHVVWADRPARPGG